MCPGNCGIVFRQVWLGLDRGFFDQILYDPIMRKLLAASHKWVGPSHYMAPVFGCAAQGVSIVFVRSIYGYNLVDEQGRFRTFYHQG